MAIAPKITFSFVGTNAGVPSGFVRDTDFDGKYVLGCSSSDTIGGATGGTLTHTHATATHVHSLGANNASGSATDPNGAVAGATPTHTHGNVNLSAVGATVAPGANEYPYYTVIYIKSLGTSTNIPEGTIVWSDSQTYDPSPFSSTYIVSDGGSSSADLKRLYLKGADTGEDAGDTGGSATHKHDFTHNHATSATSGTSTNANTQMQLRTGLAKSHTHGVTISNSASAGAYDSSSVNGEPPYLYLLPWYSTTDLNVLEDGMIAIWKGLKSAIPDNWSELTTARNYFVKSSSCTEGEDSGVFPDVGTTGGSDQHTHTSTHSHVGTTASLSTQALKATGVNTVSAATHTHTWNIGNASANFSNNTAKSNYPPYIKVFFIKYTAPTITPGAYYNGTYYNATLYKN